MTEYQQIVRSQKPNLNLVPGGVESNEKIEFNLDLITSFETFKEIIPDVYTMKIFDKFEVKKLKDFMSTSPNFESVSVQGRKDIPNDKIGSLRTTIWNENIAQEIWNKIELKIPLLVCDNSTETDWWQENPKFKNVYKPIGCTPMLRFMKYKEGGEHYAHYDAGFIYKDPKFRTLYSFVIYLTDNHESGATRFLKDGQSELPEPMKNHDDWIRSAEEEEIIFKSYPKAGYILLFPHRKCHDVEKFIGEERIIIRGDILYKRLD